MKLDIENAFDKIEDSHIIKIMHAKGFGREWIRWVPLLDGFNTSVGLLNEVLGKKYLRRRVVR
jgi:hypothetical protein